MMCYGKMPIAILVVSAVLGATAQGQSGEAVVRLKEEVYVKGPGLQLGELADIEGGDAEALSAFEVSGAANPGDTKRLNASLVEARLRGAQFEENISVVGARSVSAITLHQEVRQSRIADDLRAFIEVEMPWDPANAEVTVEVPSQPVIVSDGTVEIQWKTNPQYRYVGTGAFRGAIVVDGREEKTLHCRASVTAYTPVVVAARDIPRGTVIQPSDIELQQRAVSEMRQTPFDLKEDVVGMVARSTIFPNQVITARKVEPRRLVRRNRVVNVELLHGTLRVQSRALAMDDGREGETIRLKNVSSDEEFYGLVRSDGSILVQ